jgi:3-dehydroquinate synthase
MVGSQESREMLVKSKVRDYHVIFCNDAINKLANLVRQGDFVIIDNTVAEYYPEISEILSEYHIYKLLPAEKEKSYHNIEPLLELIVNSGFRRNNRIIAIGGGIVQDVSSFISFIIFRGVEWIFCPTNLLSQCDSCIGSKISVNLGQYKNLLGGFYPPSQVLVDPRFLDTLKDQDILSGLGEMLHYFLVSSEKDLQLFLDNSPDIKINRDKNKIENLIRRSLEIKKSMIEIDEFDQGPRHIFNYGHSFGHALETVTNYQIPHGIAVSYGIDLANLVSVHLGFLKMEERNRMQVACEMVFDGIHLPDIDISRYISALMKDKKNSRSNLGLILSKGVGKTFKHFCSYEDISTVIQSFFEEKTYLRNSDK